MQYLEAHVTFSINDLGNIYFDKEDSTVHLQLSCWDLELIGKLVEEQIMRGADVNEICDCVDMHRQIKKVYDEISKLKPAAEIIAEEERKRRQKKEEQDKKIKGEHD